MFSLSKRTFFCSGQKPWFHLKNGLKISIKIDVKYQPQTAQNISQNRIQKVVLWCTFGAPTTTVLRASTTWPKPMFSLGKSKVSRCWPKLVFTKKMYENQPQNRSKIEIRSCLKKTSKMESEICAIFTYFAGRRRSRGIPGGGTPRISIWHHFDVVLEVI